MSTPLQGTASAYNLKKVNYTHDDIISLILAEPAITQREIASRYGYSEAWVCQVMGSDAFQSRLAQRKTELIDPMIVATFEEKLAGTVGLALNVLQEKLENGRSAELAIKTLEVGAKALGYGARKENISVQQNFVLQVPPKSASAEEWAKTYGGQFTKTEDN